MNHTIRLRSQEGCSDRVTARVSHTPHTGHLFAGLMPQAYTPISVTSNSYVVVFTHSHLPSIKHPFTHSFTLTPHCDQEIFQHIYAIFHFPIHSKEHAHVTFTPIIKDSIPSYTSYISHKLISFSLIMRKQHVCVGAHTPA